VYSAFPSAVFVFSVQSMKKGGLQLQGGKCVHFSVPLRYALQ